MSSRAEGASVSFPPERRHEALLAAIGQSLTSFVSPDRRLMRTHQQQPMRPRSSEAAVTLLELLVVLVVLIALAVLVIPQFTDLRFGFAGDRKTAQQIATERTLNLVSEAILGGSGQKGLWLDLGNQDANLPQTIAELFVPRVGWPDFDPNTRRGWRGPYLLGSGARYGVTDAYGNADDPAVLDGWGQPVVIQLPDADHIRVVSKGEDGVLDTPPAVNLPTLASCGDDVVFFLRVADARP
jgi:type II secretory pathway pseudopilin PulG